MNAQVAGSNPAPARPSRVRIYFWPRDYIGDPPEHCWNVEDDGLAAELVEWLESRGYEVMMEDT